MTNPEKMDSAESPLEQRSRAHREAASKGKKRRPAREKKPKKREKKPFLMPFPVRLAVGAVCIVLSLFALRWVTLNIHPGSETTAASSTASKTSMNLMTQFNNFINNAASDALSEIVTIRKHYSIDESVTVAPEPNQSQFGSTTDPAEIQAIIDLCADLLEGQELSWNADIQTYRDTGFQYYYDETILVITWKELIDNRLCSISEVKVADGSQLRRKLANDTYSAGVQYYATDMAKDCNAVVAINGDFYAFRTIGVTVYQRQLYRFNPSTLDTCHFTASGDMLFSYAGTLTDAESTQQFVDDNDIVFTVSFGPILVDDGELVDFNQNYPIGEVSTHYSRTAIGQIDSLHYLLMTVNFSDYGDVRTATMSELASFMYQKGCQKAYALDGGQTSVMIFNGELVNHVDWGYERTMSDIIYFCTAVPEEES